MGRWLGIDVGAESVKVVEVTGQGLDLRVGRCERVEHGKAPAQALRRLLAQMDWDDLSGAAVTGRFARQLRLARVPTKQAQAMGFRALVDDEAATLVSIGSRGFSVLELRGRGLEVFRENAVCSQGTGNFLRQLVERFDLDLPAASALCEGVEDAAPLSGRCPVILKTDMTHLANKGESQARILAGLYDAVSENVQVLIKPALSPKRVFLIGGVSDSVRIRNNFQAFCARNGMDFVAPPEVARHFTEALGAAWLAAQGDAVQAADLPPLDEVVLPAQRVSLERFDPLAAYLGKVKRMPAPPALDWPEGQAVVLGFDIGSTGSKAVALPAEGEATAVVWEAYLNTNGNPVRAAQTLMQRFIDDNQGRYPLAAVGATGSGREIVGSLLSLCFGAESVFVLNEIAAHAEGALACDSSVDTIFEIGGQDAKYIRLADGRVVDAAMNEACSAGTGSFIEEQGKKFNGIKDVVHLGRCALEADSGVSLGQHCSVFMAEQIDEAVASDVAIPAIVSGIYDAIIQNYLNRVKGNRSVGAVIFCQGMPFAADALAAAVVRHTGSQVIVPPNPGTIGAQGIALLTRKSLADRARPAPLVAERFLSATVESKDVFVCKSTKGCGGAGNRCRIDRLTTLVQGQRQRFTWGGGCSMWEGGTGKRKLPDLTPDPFREREALVAALVHDLPSRGHRRVALSDEFQLKSLFPFFATFIYELGFDLVVQRGGTQRALKRGIEEANVPFCAPMQHFHGVVAELAESRADYLFLPMVRTIPKVQKESHAVLCPIVQAAPDMLRWDLQDKAIAVLSPVIDVGEGNLESAQFIASCHRLANDLGVFTVRWMRAYQKAVQVQQRFDDECLALGQRALDFALAKGLIPVVVLGRSYTIYNDVLNSNVPSILREQGAIAIPVDCYPVENDVPVFQDMYWGYGQRNLRAVWQIRRTRGIYGLWCSNYACGPDSFTLHLFAYQIEGKPFAVIETDGHAGDAGTKTRVEAFLHCVREDLQKPSRRRVNSLVAIEKDKRQLAEIIAAGETILLPRMGQGAEVAAACLRGVGIKAESLPMPDRETVQLGRRYTSGKECLPMTITLGSLLQRIEKARDTEERFAFFMPTANGPCRFGAYNLLHKITLERLGWKDRVRVWSPSDTGYFDGTPPGLAALIFTGFAAGDILLNALYDVRPVETIPGEAQRIYDQYHEALLGLVEGAGYRSLSMPVVLQQIATGRLFGCAELLRRAAADFAAIKSQRQIPTVAVVGEIYVRCDPFANDFIINRLEKNGVRALFAPFVEWLEYTDYTNLSVIRGDRGFGAQLSSLVQRRILERTYAIMGEALAWPQRTTVPESIEAAAPYIRKDLLGEAVLTVGGPLHEWRHRHIAGVVSVGPLECMPAKIAEAQFFHVAEEEGLLSLTVQLTGDPIDPEIIDNFAYEVHSRWRDGAAATQPHESWSPAEDRCRQPA